MHLVFTVVVAIFSAICSPKTQRYCLKTGRNVVVIFWETEQMLLLNHTEIPDSKIALSPLVTMYSTELKELRPFSHGYVSNVLLL